MSSSQVTIYERYKFIAIRYIFWDLFLWNALGNNKIFLRNDILERKVIKEISIVYQSSFYLAAYKYLTYLLKYNISYWIKMNIPLSIVILSTSVLAVYGGRLILLTVNSPFSA